MNLVESMGLVQKSENQEIEMIDINYIHENPENFYDTGDFEELKQAILLAGGVRQNLIVKHYRYNEFMLISGHRRYMAVKQLIKDGADIPHKLPCIIENDADMADLLLITTNSTTRKLTDWERVEQFERLEKLYEKWKDKGKTTQDKRMTLCQLIGEGRTNVGRLQAIKNNLSQWLKNEMKRGVLGISVAYEASKLPGNVQMDLYNICLDKDGLTMADVLEAEDKLARKKQSIDIEGQIDEPKPMTKEDVLEAENELARKKKSIDVEGQIDEPKPMIIGDDTSIEVMDQQPEDEDDADELNETIKDFVDRVKKMRHPRNIYSHENHGYTIRNTIRYDEFMAIGASDKNGKTIKELDIVNSAGTIGVIVYSADELAYGLAIRGQIDYIDAIFCDDIKVLGNVWYNPKLLEDKEE